MSSPAPARPLPLSGSVAVTVPLPWRIAPRLAAIAVLLATISLAGQISKYVFGHDVVFGMVKLFDVDREANVPTWFSAALLGFAAMLLALIAATVRPRAGNETRYWSGLTALFVLFSLDEVTSLHERILLSRRLFAGVGRSPDLFLFSWLVAGAVFTAFVVALYGRFVLGLPRRTRRLMMTAAAIYLAGALGAEGVGALWTMRYDHFNLGYNVITTVEELLEMLGSVLFIHALLVHLRAIGPSNLPAARDVQASVMQPDLRAQEVAP
jgi:hypothetical protein